MKNDGNTAAGRPHPLHSTKTVYCLILLPKNMIPATQTGRSFESAARAFMLIVFELRHPLAH
jgi:hypothetical protein